jgi:hypothetical protein
MNVNHTKNRPRKPKARDFQSVQQLWDRYDNHPEDFPGFDATAILALAKQVRQLTRSPLSPNGSCRGEGVGGEAVPQPDAHGPKRENHREKSAPKNGSQRELNGSSKASHSTLRLRTNHIDSQSDTEPTRTNPDEPEQPIGYKNPPKQHQFKPGNPGGPGGPRVPRSMRKIIRTAIFGQLGDEVPFAVSITTALLNEALKGNTHAIRIICENGNSRCKKSRT